MMSWFEAALERREDRAACIQLTTDFLAAPAEEQRDMMSVWDPALRWAYPNPWRLACADESPGTCLERIQTSLLHAALRYPGPDARDVLMGIAAVYHSCILAGLEPWRVFDEIAAAVGGSAAEALRRFASARPGQVSMRAFLLEAVPNPGGGYEIRANW